MSFLAQVPANSGKKKENSLFVLMGLDGIGKSYFGSKMPNPIFICTETGTSNMDINRFPTPKNWSEVNSMVDELLNSDHQFKTLVIDSLTYCEPLVQKEVCADHGVSDFNDKAIGYGKNYDYLKEKWQTFMRKLQVLKSKMHICLIGHAEVKTFQDPQVQTGYDRYQLALSKQGAAAVRQAADAVLFASYSVYTKKEGNKTRSFADGSRIMFTEYRASHDGKNRYGLPYQMPLSAEDYLKAVESVDPKQMIAQIEEMLKASEDQELKNKVMASTEKYKTDTHKLKDIIDKLQSIINE